MKFFLILLTIFISSCSRSWNYSSPQKWGDLKEEYKFCKIGYNQSPIDVKLDFQDSDLKFFYKKSSVEKEKKDFVMQINFYGKDFITRGKKKYLLERIYFHHPSEHLVKSDRHSLELQVLHKSEDEQYLILGIFLEVGAKNLEFDRLIELLSSNKKESELDLSKIVKADDKTFFYDGSFTTPPCKEGVKWYIMKTPIQISKEQMNKIIKLGIFAKSNARPAQAFHPEKY